MKNKTTAGVQLNIFACVEFTTKKKKNVYMFDVLKVFFFSPQHNLANYFSTYTYRLYTLGLKKKKERKKVKKIERTNR